MKSNNISVLWHSNISKRELSPVIHKFTNKKVATFYNLACPRFSNLNRNTFFVVFEVLDKNKKTQWEAYAKNKASFKPNKQTGIWEHKRKTTLFWGVIWSFWLEKARDQSSNRAHIHSQKFKSRPCAPLNHIQIASFCIISHLPRCIVKVTDAGPKP